MLRTLALAVVLGVGTNLPAQHANTPFDQKLTGDQAILHALNRLTFGPRPGDIEAVKKIGLKQWIDLQLHPERLPTDEALETLANSFVEPARSRSGPVCGYFVPLRSPSGTPTPGPTDRGTRWLDQPSCGPYNLASRRGRGPVKRR